MTGLEAMVLMSIVDTIGAGLVIVWHRRSRGWTGLPPGVAIDAMGGAAPS